MYVVTVVTMYSEGTKYDKNYILAEVIQNQTQKITLESEASFCRQTHSNFNDKRLEK